MNEGRNGCSGCLAVVLLSILYVAVTFVITSFAYWMICMGFGLTFNIWMVVGIVGVLVLLKLAFGK